MVSKSPPAEHTPIILSVRYAAFMSSWKGVADTSKVKVAFEQSTAISGPSTCCGRVIFWTVVIRFESGQYAAGD